MKKCNVKGGYCGAYSEKLMTNCYMYSRERDIKSCKHWKRMNKIFNSMKFLNQKDKELIENYLGKKLFNRQPQKNPVLTKRYKIPVKTA